MQDILRCLDALATNSMLRAATQSQVVQLKEGIGKLALLKPDSRLEGSGMHISQHISQDAGDQQCTKLLLKNICQ